MCCVPLVCSIAPLLTCAIASNTGCGPGEAALERRRSGGHSSKWERVGWYQSHLSSPCASFSRPQHGMTILRRALYSLSGTRTSKFDSDGAKCDPCSHHKLGMHQVWQGMTSLLTQHFARKYILQRTCASACPRPAFAREHRRVLAPRSVTLGTSVTSHTPRDVLFANRQRRVLLARTKVKCAMCSYANL